ncbi:MAG: DUF4349 domain-containing protein [Myxococcota bacterium]
MSVRVWCALFPLLLGCAASAPESRARSSSARADLRADTAGRSIAADEGQADHKLVRTAWLTLEVPAQDQVSTALADARRLATSLGGYVEAERTDAVTVKIPNERLETAIAQIERGGKLTRRDVEVQNVTAEYTDLAIRIENARTMRQRLQALLERTDDVQKLLEIERELGRVTVELERLEGQMRLMENQVQFATLYLTVEKELRPGPLGWVVIGMARATKWLFIQD